MNNQQFTTELEAIVRPGRKVANTFQGGVNAESLNSLLAEGNSAEKVLLVLKSLFQPERQLQEVVIPYFRDFLRLVTSQPRLVIYKGVSFNPLIPTYGENVNLLDFYSWLKQAQMPGFIVEASLYSIVNAAKEKPVESFSQTSAEEAIRFLNSKKASFPNIIEASSTRERYLRAASTALFSRDEAPRVISGEELWRDKTYINALQEAISFCGDNPREGAPFEVIRYANYERYDTEFQRWYTILVLAEALYLNRKYGVNVKLGPTSETNFDSMMRQFMKARGIQFGFIWYNRDVEKQIPYPERVSFDDNTSEVRRKLSNPQLKRWVEEIIRPFGEDSIVALMTRVKSAL